MNEHCPYEAEQRRAIAARIAAAVIEREKRMAPRPPALLLREVPAKQPPTEPWWSKAHAARRAFSSAHPLGLTRREHDVVLTIALAPGIFTPAIRARARMGRHNFASVIMNARRKLAARNIALISVGKPARWRLSTDILPLMEAVTE